MTKQFCNLSIFSVFWTNVPFLVHTKCVEYVILRCKVSTFSSSWYALVKINAYHSDSEGYFLMEENKCQVQESSA